MGREADEEDFEFFHSPKLPLRGQHFPIERAILVTCIGVGIVVLILICNHRNWRRTTLSKVNDDDSIITAIAKFRMSISSPHDTLVILQTLRKRIHRNPVAVMNAVEASLPRYLLDCVKELKHNDSVCY
jgi:hypothetical protein